MQSLSLDEIRSVFAGSEGSEKHFAEALLKEVQNLRSRPNDGDTRRNFSLDMVNIHVLERALSSYIESLK